MKKILILFSTLFLVIVSASINNVTAYDMTDDEYYDLYYEEICEKIEEQETIDEELKSTYGEFVEIIDEKYVFYYEDIINSENQQEIEFINSNIETINELVDTGEVYIEDDEVIFLCDDELDIQFGIKKISAHWYGFDFSLDREAMMTVGIISVLARVLSGISLNAIMNNQISMEPVAEAMKIFIKSSSFAGSVSCHFLSKRIEEDYGSWDAFFDVLASLLSTATIAYTGYLAVLAATTGGIGVVVMTVIKYIIGIYTPGMITGVTASIYGITGLCFTRANMTVRWFRGWGTNLYFFA